MRIRWHLAKGPAVASAALDIFLRALFAFHRKRARDGKPGSVTFVQRFGSAMQLNLHLHALLPDGVFVEPAGAAPDAPLCFHALPGPVIQAGAGSSAAAGGTASERARRAASMGGPGRGASRDAALRLP